MSLYEKLQEFAKKENIIAGVGSAEAFDELKLYLKNKVVPFVNYTVEERTEPKLIMESVKSIVAIGLSYNVVYSRIKDSAVRGNMSAGAVGTDYHIEVTEKLKKLKEEIIPWCEYKIFADTGPLSDRDVAIRCSLGSRGKNGCVINSKIGGMFFIGYMLTDIEFDRWEAKKGEEVLCGDCDRCIKACPNGAIDDGICDYSKCISYITQKKGVLTDREYESLGRQIYGCDVCQRVCPYNKEYEKGESEYAYPDICRLLKMSNKEFKKIYGNTAAGWRGKRTLQRNAIAVLGNMGDKRAVYIAEEFLLNENEDLRSAAEYALKKLKKGD